MSLGVLVGSEGSVQSFKVIGTSDSVFKWLEIPGDFIRQEASITWCDLFWPKFGQKMPKIISLHDVLEPLKQALLASRDVIISSQICGSNLQKVFTLGDGCWLPIHVDQVANLRVIDHQEFYRRIDLVIFVVVVCCGFCVLMLAFRPQSRTSKTKFQILGPSVISSCFWSLMQDHWND